MERYTFVEAGGDSPAEVIKYKTGEYVLYSEAQARVDVLEKALKIIAHQTKDSLFATQKRVNQIAQQALQND